MRISASQNGGAGIDVHKRMLAVALADVEVDADFHFELRAED
jgi:hypothetical protein